MQPQITSVKNPNKITSVIQQDIITVNFSNSDPSTQNKPFLTNKKATGRKLNAELYHPLFYIH